MKASPAVISRPPEAPEALEAPNAVGRSRTVLDESYEWCRQLSRARARNFYYGMKLTPAGTRRSMYAVYAWMRAADDLADGPAADNGHAGAAAERLEALRALTHRMIASDKAPEVTEAEGGAFAAMWPAVRETFRGYEIPIEYLDAMIDGQLLDVRQHVYHTFEDLYDYCYKVASVVGLTCIEVWGHDKDASVRKLAEHRGIAFQLTNILRDVVEDAGRGRTYLPSEDFEKFDLSPNVLRSGKLSDGGQAFDRFMAFEIQRAQSYYDRSLGLEAHLSAPCRAASWAMMRTYRDLLGRIRHDPRRVLRGSVRLSGVRKSSIVLAAACRRVF